MGLDDVQKPGSYGPACFFALRLNDQRAIVLSGWAGLSFELLRSTCADDRGLVAYAEENVLFVIKAPHTWLFPQMPCAVHHGIGTTNAVLRAGNPMVITRGFLRSSESARAPHSF